MRPRWRHTFRQIEGAEVVAYCEDTDTDRLKDVSVYAPDARAFVNVDDLIDKADFDFAFLVLPANEILGVGIKLANTSLWRNSLPGHQDFIRMAHLC